MTEMVDGWVEVPAVHEPIVRTRSEKKKRIPAQRDKESESRVAAAEYLVSHSPPFFPFNWLIQDSRSCLMPLNDPLKLPSSKGGLHRRYERARERPTVESAA